MVHDEQCSKTRAITNFLLFPAKNHLLKTTYNFLFKSLHQLLGMNPRNEICHQFMKNASVNKVST